MTSTPPPPGHGLTNGSVFWASNAVFFIVTHCMAIASLYVYSPTRLPRATVVMIPILWHFAMFGIAVGYHRLWSHRSFRAGRLVRMFLAFGGASAVQGSIKWWCLRHRLHHRFTDDPVHDPYAATRGMLFAHMGWIFFKPSYSRMNLIDREDLERDPVVRLQHRYYVSIALFMGFIFPALLGALWNDALGGFLYGAVWNRVLIWHCTFLVNSLAHWHGLQPYSDEVTARGNLLLAMLTNGEGNHNFHHAFPHDFRAGMHASEYDPSKWLLLFLRRLRLVWGLRQARQEDIAWAVEDMRRRHSDVKPLTNGCDNEPDAPSMAMPTWSLHDVQDFVHTDCRCALLIDGFVIDATSLLGDHPGGGSIIRAYAYRGGPHTQGQHCAHPDKWLEGQWAFHGGLNNHSRAANRRVRELRVARFQSSAEDAGSG